MPTLFGVLLSITAVWTVYTWRAWRQAVARRGYAWTDLLLVVNVLLLMASTLIGFWLDLGGA